MAREFNGEKSSTERGEQRGEVTTEEGSDLRIHERNILCKLYIQMH